MQQLKKEESGHGVGEMAIEEKIKRNKLQNLQSTTNTRPVPQPKPKPKPRSRLRCSSVSSSPAQKNNDLTQLLRTSELDEKLKRWKDKSEQD